jgi:hypothetical protein
MSNLILINDNIDTIKPTNTKYYYEIVAQNNTQQNETKYELWEDDELEYISKVDLSTPLEDDEDYSKW